MPDNVLPDPLLDSFPHSKFNGVVYQYNTGHSGSPVFAVHYKPRNKYGLDGTFIVKIGSQEWAEKEQDFYDNLPNNELDSLLMRGHMHTSPLNGLSAVAYEVAFDAIIKPKPLMDILDEGEASETEAQKQIERLAHTLVNWYLKSDEQIVRDPHELLHHMLTEKRVLDLLERIEKALPFWKAEASQIIVEERSRLLPNPLAYKLVCDKITYNPVCPTARIHGDLHTGNVICFLESEQVPKLIDFDQSTPDGVPFFDLAYLEFDIIRHLLSVEQKKNREEWLALLNSSMTAILGGPAINSWGASRAWPFLKPIRQEVLRLRQAGGEAYEVVWWLATVATGLNFARKGDETRSRFERIAGLLYAAYGLERIMTIFSMKELPMKEAPFRVPWIEGDFSSHNLLESSTLSPPQNNLSEPPASDIAPPTQASPSTKSDKDALPPAYQSPSPDTDSTPTQQSALERSENSLLASIAETATQEFEKKRAGERKRSEYFSATTADELQSLLQEAIDLFQTGGSIFKDMCETTEQRLQQFAPFLQETLQNIPESDYFVRFSLKKLAKEQKKLCTSLRNFRECCPPAPARKLSETRYDEERAAISNKLEEFQTKFRELRQKTL